jgi:hypothetical protein
MSVFDLNKLFKHTTESSTGRKILAVLKFDVTSVKKALITIIIHIKAALGMPVKNRSASATLFDKPELLFINREKMFSYIF